MMAPDEDRRIFWVTSLLTAARPERPPVAVGQPAVHSAIHPSELEACLRDRAGLGDDLDVRLPIQQLGERAPARHAFWLWPVAGSPDTAQVTVIENVRSANDPRESVARTTNVNVPRAVGVPVILPGLAESRKPGGSAPERSVHVYPGTPPSANRFPQQ